MDDFETWRQQQTAPPVDDFSRWRASQQTEGQSIPGAQQSVYDPGAEAILGVSPEPPKSDFQQWREKSLTEKMIDLAPAPVIPGVPIPIPGGVGIARRLGEAVYGKPIGDAAMPALEAALDIPTAGLATAIPAAWGAAKGVASIPGAIEPGASLPSNIGRAAAHVAESAAGESPLVSAVVERLGGKPPERVSEGRNVSEVNRMVTGAPLPQWSQTAIDVAGGTLGMVGAEKGIGGVVGAVKAYPPEVKATPSEAQVAEMTRGGELPKSPTLDITENARMVDDALLQSDIGRIERQAQAGGLEGVAHPPVVEPMSYEPVSVPPTYPGAPPYKYEQMMKGYRDPPTNWEGQPVPSRVTMPTDVMPAAPVSEHPTMTLPIEQRGTAYPEGPTKTWAGSEVPRYDQTPTVPEMPAVKAPSPAGRPAAPPSAAEAMATGERATPAPLPLAEKPAASPPVTMAAEGHPKPLDAVDSIIDHPGTTTTKGSPIEEVSAGANPMAILKQTASKYENAEIVRKNGSKFRILDILRSPANIPTLKPVFELAQRALDKAQLGARQKDGVKAVIQKYLGTEDATYQAFGEAMFSGDAAGKRWTLPEFTRIVKSYSLTPEQQANVWKAYNVRRNYSDFLHREMAQAAGKSTEQQREAVRILQNAEMSPQLKAKALDKLGLGDDDAESIAKIFSNYREGHVPHNFYENMVYRVDPATGEQTVLKSFKTLNEAVTYMDAQAAAAPGANFRVIPKSARWTSQSAKAAIGNDQRYTNLTSRMERMYDMSSEEAHSFLEQAGLKPNPKGQFLTPAGRGRQFGHLKQRTGAEGWNKDDILELFDSYDKGAVRYISTQPFKKNSTAIFEKMYGTTIDAPKNVEQSFVADYIKDVNGVPTKVEEALNSLFVRLAPGIAERMPTSRPAIWTANKINHAVSVAKLGVWNPSALFVNLTQNILTFAMSDAQSFGAALAKTANPDKQARAIWRQLHLTESTNLAEAGAYTMSSKAGDIVNGSMALFGFAEKKNRQIAALAGYDQAVRAGATHKDALEAARELIRKTQFEYNVIDTPLLFRGPMGRTLGQFKQYGTKYIETVTGMVVRKDAKQFMKWAVPTAALTGMAGIPFAKAANSIAVSLLGDEYDVETQLREGVNDWMSAAPDDKVRQFAGQTALYGIAGPTLGVDVSQRIGQSDILPFFEKPEQLLGPAVSTAITTIKNVAGLGEGRTSVEDVIKGISPGAEGVYFKGREIYKKVTGDKTPTVVTGQYGENMYEPTEGEKIAKSMSFRPVRESEIRQNSRAQQVYRQLDQRYKKAVLASILSGSGSFDKYFDRWIEFRIKAGEPIDADAITAALEDLATKQAIDRPTRQVMDEKIPVQQRLNILNQMR